MLISLNNMLDNKDIEELIGYAVFPDPDRIKKAIEMYDFNKKILMGYLLDDKIIGIIGYVTLPDELIKITHISIKPEYRGIGYGRGIILELIDQIKPHKIIAETDHEAVDFYRNIGFEIISLGEKYPLVERFECTFVTDFYQ